MSEPTAEYIVSDETRRCAEAIAAEKAQVKGMSDWLLGVIDAMNSPPIEIHVWRCAIQQVYERLAEAVGND